MIDLLDHYSSDKRLAAIGLADTLHNLGVLDDVMFDCLLTELYEKYGDDYGDILSDDYL